MILIFIIVLSEEDFEKIRLGDSKAFEKIYNEYKLKLYNFLIIKVNGDIHAAEEILSDTIYSALIAAPKLKSRDKIHPWLFRIASRRFYDHLRQKYKDKKLNDSAETTDSTFSGESNEAEENEKIVMMKTAMENLKPVYKKILKLKYIEEKTQNEIAEVLNKSRLSIESLLYRAREALKLEIKKLYKEFQ